MKQQLRQEHRFPAHMQSQSSQRPAGEVSRINQLISPGHLPNNLTVEKIRNPILVSYVAKGLLPYHGLGSGIQRALEQWPLIEFVDDPDGCTFTVTVTRKPIGTLQLANEAKPEKDHLKDLSGQYDPINDLLNAIRGAPHADYATLAQRLGISESTVKRKIQKLKQQNCIRRLGSKKTGRWEIIE